MFNFSCYTALSFQYPFEYKRIAIFHGYFYISCALKGTNGRQKTYEIFMFAASFILVSCVKLP